MRDEGLPAQITGLWVGTPTRDYVFYRASLDGCHREQTILHEFAHMICDHRPARVADPQWLRERCPWISDLGDVEHVCMRSDYDSPDEREAELLASLILARSTRRPGHRRARSSQEEQAHRVEDIFRT